MAERIAQIYSFPGAEADDVRQEALVGLVRGIRSFRPGRGMELTPFLAMAIRRQIFNGLRAATRGKHEPLNRSIREGETDDGFVVDVVETLTSGRDAFDDLVDRLEAGELLEFVQSERLSLVERRAVIGRAVGMTYAELGPTKTVDNALQRAREKLKAAA
jgi:RNA polymerase sporulation-specific sigma factor